MRDRQAYIDAGRNDPGSAEQRAEHPYDFVSLPSSVAQGAAVTRDKTSADRLSGSLSLVYITESPLHVGSGVFETAEECGLSGGAKPVRGIVRRAGEPVLPGSGWKGAVRTRVEAITRSRLCLADTRSKEPTFKVPEALCEPGDKESRRGSYTVRVDDPKVRRLAAGGMVRGPGDLPELSPADALFGAMGYRGRVRPEEGVIEGPRATHPLSVAPLDGPVMHRLAKPGEIKKTGHRRLTIQKVEGRKFYYDGEIVQTRGERNVSEPVDQVPTGSRITLRVHLSSVTRAELGALLVSAGYGEGSGVTRFGGFKPVGLGKVRLEGAEAELRSGGKGAARTWRRPPAEPVDLDSAVRTAFDTELIDAKALAELHEITTIRRSPS